jgi:hypothetical protein
VDAEVRSERSGQYVAKLVEVWRIAKIQLRFRYDAAHALAILHWTYGIDTLFAMADAQGRFGRHFSLENQVTDGWLPTLKGNAGLLTDEAPAPVASDEIFCPQRTAVAKFDVHAGVVLLEVRDSAAAIDGHGVFGHPFGECTLDPFLPKCEGVVVAGEEAIERGAAGLGAADTVVDVLGEGLEAAGGGVGAKGIELHFRALVGGRNADVESDAGHGFLQCRDASSH